jgi:hypothetical protein
MKVPLNLSRVLMLAVAAGGLAGSIGCQVEIGGQTLPSGYYLSDDVQYYPPAPQTFKLSREAAAIAEAQAEVEGSAPQP